MADDLSKTMMDKKKKELEEHLVVVTWLKDHWEMFPDDLFQRLDNGIEIPFSVQAYIQGLLRGDLANILTVVKNWRVMDNSKNERQDLP
jgi:hypothetical protein